MHINLLFCLKLCILELRRGTSAKLHMICTLPSESIYSSVPVSKLLLYYSVGRHLAEGLFSQCLCVCCFVRPLFVTVSGVYASHSAWPLEWAPRTLKHFECGSCLPELQCSSWQPARIPQFSTMCITVLNHRLPSGLQYQKLILKPFTICKIETDMVAREGRCFHWNNTVFLMPCHCLKISP